LFITLLVIGVWGRGTSHSY